MENSAPGWPITQGGWGEDSTKLIFFRLFIKPVSHGYSHRIAVNEFEKPIWQQNPCQLFTVILDSKGKDRVLPNRVKV